MCTKTWDAAIGVLACEREPHNVEDRYAVAVKKDEASKNLLPACSRISPLAEVDLLCWVEADTHGCCWIPKALSQ